MFSGIVEGRGSVLALQDKPNFTVGIRTPFAGERFPEGCSVAVNGCCLTVLKQRGTILTFEIGAETRAKTNLGRLAICSEVNLERAARLDQRMDGHLVSGHVDTLGEIRERKEVDGLLHLNIAVAKHHLPYITTKGSVAIDGVSLTINEIDNTEATFRVGILPYTADTTTLGRLNKEDTTNVEFDLLGKYVVRYLSLLKAAKTKTPVAETEGTPTSIKEIQP